MAILKKRKPTAVDVFSGAGGLTEGLKQARFNVLGAIECDAVAVETYRMNHRRTHVFEMDVRLVGAEALLSKLGLKSGELDLLAGCPPCQPFSNLRRQSRDQTRHDESSDLIFELLRLAEGVRPRAIMLENVPNLASDDRFHAFQTGLERLGYTVAHRMMDAQYFGVPQRRKRLVLVAHKGRAPAFPGRARHAVSVSDAIGHLPAVGTSGDPLHDVKESRAPHIMRLIKAVPRDGGSRSSVPARLLLPCHRKHQGHYDVFGRMAWDSPAPTITTGCNNPSRGRFVHPVADRAITLREAALLQTFPATYMFSMRRGKEHVAQQIGNALPPELIRRIASRIHQVLGSAES